MAINHEKLKPALKIMNEVPKSLEATEKLYKERLKEIKAKEATGNWSPNAIEKDRARAKADRNLVVDRLIKQMETAVYTISQNNSFEDEKFDFSDSKFQSALNFLSLMGQDMTAKDQINLLEQFRGNPGALNALGAAMKKNKLYFADRATEMTKTISQTALEDAAYVIGKYKYSGVVDTSRMRWSGSEFKKMSERMGYDMTDAPDPYLSALSDARNSIPVSDDPTEEAKNNAKRLKIDLAMREVKKASLENGNVEEVFTKVARGIESNSAEGNV